jgi:glutathione S-transferase
MLTVHHLGTSQSERVVWLCEELGVPYVLKRYTRDPVTNLSPPELERLHPLGAAPVVTDDEDDSFVLAESGAIVEYIIARHGNGRLALKPEHPDFAHYVYWFHFANASLQALMHRCMMLRRLQLAPDHPVLAATTGRLERALRMLDDRLEGACYLAGTEFTAADIMIVFTLTTVRYFNPVDLAPYPQILSYLQRIGQREGYRAAMSKGDPDMELLLT